jgi:HPt (histidine-containing phosphotransfer) domain-containing protein
LREGSKVTIDPGRIEVSETGNTTTSQMSQHALALRFLTRAQTELAQMRACMPADPIGLEPVAVAQVERVAHKMSGEAEAFGFPEISAIAAAIELMASGHVARTVRERHELFTRLVEQMTALEIYVEYELAERAVQQSAKGVPMSALLPGFSARQK